MSNFNRDGRSGPRRDFGQRDFRKRDFGDRGRREMHKAVCAECGKECEIPFEPRDGRPVYCSDCFEKKDGGSQNQRGFEDRGRDRGPRRPRFEDRGRDRPRHQAPQNNEQMEAISRKLDKILELLATAPVKVEKKEVEVLSKPKKVKTEEKKKPVKVTKKKVTAKK